MASSRHTCVRPAAIAIALCAIYLPIIHSFGAEEQAEVKHAIEQTKSEDLNEMVRGALFLSKANNIQGVSSLMELTKSNRSFRNMIGSLALSRSACKNKIELAQSLLDSDKWWQRRNGAWILGQIRETDRKSTDRLLALLKDESWQVRMYASWALGRLQVNESVPALKELAKQSEKMKDGAEASHAVETIAQKPKVIKIEAQPAWLLVADQDIPLQEVSGPVIEVEKSADNFFGYHIQTEKSQENEPLRVTIWNFMVVYWTGTGKIKDKWIGQEVLLVGDKAPKGK